MSARRVVMHEKMPDRPLPADRISHLDADVRDATARARRRAEDYAQQYTVAGWTIDDAEWVVGINGRTVTVIMRLTRPS